MSNGDYSNSDVDHIIPLHLGGSCDVSNLQILCVPCHRKKTSLECKKLKRIVSGRVFDCLHVTPDCVDFKVF